MAKRQAKRSGRKAVGAAMTATRADRAKFEAEQYRKAHKLLMQLPAEKWASSWRHGEFAAYRHGEYNRTHRARKGHKGTGDYLLDQTEREDIMYRARDLERCNAVARGMLERCVDNIVADGITVQARTGNEKLDGAQEEAFNAWAESGADIRGQLSYWEIQRLRCRTRLRDGDCGFIKTNGALQAIESERITDPAAGGKVDKARRDRITQGVEMDSVGRPLYYWIADYFGSVGARAVVNPGNVRPVPAKNFLHCYAPERFSQTRGASIFSSNAAYFDLLDQYIEYELVGAGVAACLSAVILGDERTRPMEPFKEEVDDAAGNAQTVFDLEPGAIFNLSGITNGKLEVINPNKPPAQFANFVEMILRFLGLPMGLPLELIALSYRGGNYSQSRLAMLQAYRTFRVQQAQEVSCDRKIWRWKQEEFNRSGVVKPPKSVPDAALYRHTWQPHAWEWIDPEKEMNAKAKGMDRGAVLLQDIAQERGMDASDLINARAEEIAFAMTVAKAKGIGDYREILRADLKDKAEGGSPKVEGKPGQDENEMEKENGDADTEAAQG